MTRTDSASRRFGVGQGPPTSPENNPELWVQLGEEACNTNLEILCWK